MPRREWLTPAERESLLSVPVIEADQIRHYAGIRQHRWDYNRLGVAIQLPTALQTIQGIVLVQSAIEEIRARRPVVPTVRVLELIAAQATTRADRQVFIELTAALTAEQLRSGSPYSHLAWLRMPPIAPSSLSRTS